MEEIREMIALNCSQAQAETRLPKYFNSIRDRSGLARLRLRIALDDFGLPGDLELSRAVIVDFKKQRDTQNLNDEFAIHWKPEGTGPFPEFHGHLTVWSEDDPRRSFLEIEGTYEPPLGKLVGEAFDATIGHLIALRTAKMLLDDIKAGIERLHDEENT